MSEHIYLDNNKNTQRCGLNDRGDQTRSCTKRQWGDYSPCDNPNTYHNNLTENHTYNQNNQNLEKQLYINNQ